VLKTFEIKLDIEKELYNPSNILFSVSRNDLESIELQFEITQDNAAMDLTGTTIEMGIKKPSGLVVYQAAEITDAVAGKAAARLSIQAYVEYGVHTAEVYVRNASQMAITSPFYFMSREAIMETEEIESVNDWSALQQALFSMDKKPILIDGVPTTIPEYVGQMAFDITGKRAFIANDVTETGWQLLAAGEGGGGGIVYWADIIGKPSAFTPEIHTHDFVDITGKPAAYPPENHMHNIAAIEGLDAALAGKADDADLVPFITEAEADLKYSFKGEGGGGGGGAWGEITGTLANQTDLQTALNGKADDADLAAKADAVHTHNFADIANKPATYPAEAHNHAIADVTGLDAALAGKADDADLAAKANAADVYTKAQTYNKTEIDQMTMGEGGGSPVIVEDNLSSTSTTNALSANQGRILDTTKADAAHTHDFADITGKPATYPAEAHNHAIADVTGLDAALAGKADDADLAGKADAVHSHTFADITAKPATYPPDVHSHAFADITGKPATYPPDVHTHAFADITGKPATYPAEAHEHTAANITDFGTAVAANIPAEYLTTTEGDARYLDAADIAGKQDKATTTTGIPTTAPAYFGQIAIDTGNKNTYIAEGTAAADWKKLVDSYDLSLKSDTGHSHTAANISDFGTAVAAAIPAEYLTATEGDAAYQAKGAAPAAHTHTEADLTFGAKNAKTYVDDADNYILNTKMAGLTLWKGTQAAYDGLTPDPNTLYFIVG
jgi:hypothetical protein